MLRRLLIGRFRGGSKSVKVGYRGWAVGRAVLTGYVRAWDWWAEQREINLIFVSFTLTRVGTATGRIDYLTSM